MEILILTIIGAGGATLAGAATGFLFRRLSERCGRILLAVCPAVLIYVATMGLMVPAARAASAAQEWMLPAGLVCGMLTACAAGRMPGPGTEAQRTAAAFAMAAALHKLPEGLIMGIGLGGMSASAAVPVTAGMAVHNIPEGLMLVLPLLAAGAPRRHAVLAATASCALNILGILLGCCAARTIEPFLPFALTFAAGAMLNPCTGGRTRSAS